MKTRITPWAVVALFVSLLSMLIFALLFETYGSLNSALHFFWAITCTASVILPIVSKYHRSHANSRGKGIEIFALVISFFNCQFFLLFTTSINGTVCLLIGCLFVILYVKLFNNSTPEPVPNIGEGSASQKSETYYYMEAANGMTVRVPESRLEAWQTEQDRIRNNPDAAKLTETEKQLVDAIVRDIYGPKDAHITSTESTSTIETIQKSNQRYCRLCGGAIDLNSKICTKCGKQYFSLQLTLSKLKKPFIATLVLVLISSNIYLMVSLLNTQRDLAVYQEDVSILTNDNLAYEERISNLTFQLDDLGNEIDNLQTQKNDMKNELSAARKKIAFYDQRVVFAFFRRTNNRVDIYYHKYDCPTFQGLIKGSGLIGVYDANSVDVKNKLTCTYCRD